MHLLSISKAAKLFDVSRPTLLKALKGGRLSGIKTEKDGAETWQIDPSELARLYKLRDPAPGKFPDKPEAIGQALAIEKTNDNGELPDEYVKKAGKRNWPWRWPEPRNGKKAIEALTVALNRITDQSPANEAKQAEPPTSV